MTSTLRTLLDRVEKGEGRDLSLEGDLLRVLLGDDLCQWPKRYLGLGEAITSSIDAAVALVEKVLPGHDHEVFRDRDAKLVTVDLTKPIGGGASSGYLGQHAEEPRATLLALLRAKIAQEEGA